MRKAEQLSIEDRLKAIDESPVQGVAYIDQRDVVRSLNVSLPENHSFSGWISKVNGRLDLDLDFLSVNRDLQNHGIGTRLLSSITDLAMTNGVDTLSSTTRNPFVIKMLQRLYGDTHITYEDFDPVDQRIVTLPISSKTALDTLERTQNDPQIDDAEALLGLYFTVDLGKLALESFEEPITKQEFVTLRELEDL